LFNVALGLGMVYGVLYTQGVMALIAAAMALDVFTIIPLRLQMLL
jgi:hypothetical protein